MRAGNAGGENSGALRLDCNDLDFGLLGLEEPADAGDRAAGANACNENVNFTVGICKNLRAGDLKVRLGVCGIDELAGDEAVGDLLCKLVGLGDSALHALCALGEYELRAVRLHKLAALNAHGLWHDDDYAVASCGGDGCKADARVAAGRLNDHGAFFQNTLLLRIVEHCLGNSVLHAPRGIEIFQLCKNFCFKRAIFFIVCKVDKRRVADQVGYFFINFHCNFLFIFCGVSAVIISVYIIELSPICRSKTKQSPTSHPTVPHFLSSFQ